MSNLQTHYHIKLVSKAWTNIKDFKTTIMASHITDNMTCFILELARDNYTSVNISMASCQKGPTRHAYAWQIGPFWQDTIDIWVVQYCHTDPYIYSVCIKGHK